MGGLTSERANEIAAENWKIRRERGTDTWARTGEEWAHREYTKYFSRVSDKLSSANLLEERDFGSLIAAMILLPDHYRKVCGSMRGYIGVPTHILRDSAGVHLGQFFETSKSYLGIFHWEKGENGEDRWAITTRLQNQFAKYARQVSSNMQQNWAPKLRFLWSGKAFA